jgi:hypothetical protein
MALRSNIMETITTAMDIILWVILWGGNTASGYNSLPSNTTGV